MGEEHAVEKLSRSLQHVGLQVHDKHFRVRETDEANNKAISVEGRVDADDELPSLSVVLKFSHSPRQVEGTLTGELKYLWTEDVDAELSELLVFARERAVIAAFNAVAALFADEFQNYGVRIAFPPPHLAYEVASVLTDAVRQAEIEPVE